MLLCQTNKGNALCAERKEQNPTCLVQLHRRGRRHVLHLLLHPARGEGLAGRVAGQRVAAAGLRILRSAAAALLEAGLPAQLAAQGRRVVVQAQAAARHDGGLDGTGRAGSLGGGGWRRSRAPLTRTHSRYYGTPTKVQRNRLLIGKRPATPGGTRG